MEYLKKYLKFLDSGKDKRKVFERLIIVLIIGIVFMVIGDVITVKTEPNTKEIVEDEVTECRQVAFLEEKGLEKEMEEILGNMDGVGKIRIMLTYHTGKEIVHQIEKREVTNVTEENDGGGGNRTIKQCELQNNVMFEEEGGGKKKAVIKKEIEPVVRGVVIVAEGAENDAVKRNLQVAAQVLADVPIHKISVFAMKK